MAVANTLPLIVLLASAPIWARANAVPRNDPASGSLSLEKVFGADMSGDQREMLGPSPSLEKLRDALTPEQRDAVRSRLSARENSANTPEDLAAVARGYLLLDEHAPDAGRGALRVAEQLRRLRPNSSDGYELTAEGLSQSGDYPAAAQWAKKALELNPQDANARAVYMFTKDRTKRGDASAATSSPSSPIGAFTAGRDRGISPEAQTFMDRAVAARRKGDVNAMWESAQAAMNANPKSKEVQAFYSQAAGDHGKYAETKADVEKSMSAFESGDDAGAVEWARRAAERSGDETIGKIYETMKAKVAKRREAGGGEHPKPAGGAPLWPLAGLGLAAGIGLYRGSKRTYASEDGLNPDPEVAPGQSRRNSLTVAAVAGAAFVGLAAWEFGPAMLAALSAAGSSTPTMAPTFAGASIGAGAIASEPVAVGTTKAGLATAGVYAGVKTISDNVSFAKSDGEEAAPQDKLFDTNKRSEPASKDLVEAGDQPDRNNLTKAGRALQKHGHRQGSAFPKVSGSELNETGREILSDIVSNPRSGKRIGKYLDIISPDGRGARFTPDGTRFVGFLEP